MVVTRRENMNKAIADLQSAQAAASGAADRLGDTSLRAPFGGIVSRRYVDNFQEVNAKQVVISLDDLSSFEILVYLPEIVVALMAEPDKAENREVPGYAEFAGVPETLQPADQGVCQAARSRNPDVPVGPCDGSPCGCGAPAGHDRNRNSHNDAPGHAGRTCYSGGRVVCR